MTRLDCGVDAAGRGLSPIHLFIALLTALDNCNTSGLPREPERFPQDLPRHDVVHPTRVDARGHFLSNFLSHHVGRVQRREASEGPAEGDRVYYQLWHGGHSLHFNLTLNPHLLAPGLLTERRRGGVEGARLRPAGSSQCHFLGEVRDGVVGKGSAAISTCDGLTGLFRVSHEEFFIRPLERSSGDTSAPQSHAVYKRQAGPPSRSPAAQPNGTCGITDSHRRPVDLERRRERWEHRQQRRSRRIRQRSVSKEKWVETLVVADAKMVEHHGSKAVESYVLAVMNIVAGLFRDASIGNAINIVVVRLILLEQEEEDLKITHHADNSLNGFCKWQKKLNTKGEEHPLHHDVAVLPHQDICAAANAPCATLGLSHVAGMCQSHRSCSISEDTGLPLAFTVAHELGHNFGIQHDGNGNDCEPIGKRPFVMSPQLLYGTSPPRWSRCSRRYITRSSSDRGWGWCLDDAPVRERPLLLLDSELPGVLYSAAHQCRLQYGSGSVLCDDMDDVCSTLWCTVGATCHSKLNGAVDGTACGDGKWCFGGECVAVGSQPESVDGGWAAWSEWSACSRTCGTGVRSAQRDCENPAPKHRGKYCLGERRRYKICNNAPCPPDRPTFRDIQCGHFNAVPYKGKFYKWEAVINKVSPCELHCRPLDEHFSEKMQEAVADGTPCYEGNKSRDVCVNGICKSLGCDYVIDSGAVEDRCGVCHGNGSTCTTVRRTFEETEGLGYVDIGLIPEAAWDIRIEEVAEAENFLALRSDNPNKYFLNGGWTIQWNGEYKAAGTVFTYERTGHLENLTSPGPTMEPLWIQLLFQESNPGVRYEYTISRNVSEDSNTSASVFFWKHGSWTQCSVTCGTGVQRQIVHCVEKTTGIVEEHLCDPATRPDDNQTICSKEPCPAMWWVGDWHKCSASCGSSGLTRRTVLCIQAVSAEEQKALEPAQCAHIPRPESLSSCSAHLPCPADWSAASWSKCSLTCGSGLRRRNVTCSGNTGVDCDPQRKPPAVTACLVQDCSHEVENFGGGGDWSGSGWSGERSVPNEIESGADVKPPPRHGTTRAQPRTNGNRLGNAVEGDLRHHNELESTDRLPEGGVQVDDFYYDYNFINFHEDLSDDVGADGKDSGGRHGIDAPPGVGGSETTKPPSGATAYTTKAPRNTGPEGTKEAGDAAAKEPMRTNSEDLSDLLTEDYLLPAFTTRPPPPFATRTPAPKDPPEEGVSRAAGLVSTTGEPALDVKWERYGEEAEKNYDALPEGVGVTPVPHAHQSGANSSAEREEVESPVGSPSPETVNQVGTEVQPEESAPEIPQTTSRPTPAFTLEGLDSDPNPFDRVYATSEGSSRYAGRDLGATSPPSALPAVPFPHISGNREASDGATTPPSGTGITPPTGPGGAARPAPAGGPPAAAGKPTQAAFAERTGASSTPPGPSPDPADSDYNGIAVLPMVRGGGADPGPSNRLPTEAPAPAGSVSPAHPPIPASTSTAAAYAQDTAAAYWVTGKWSACSTSCGLGAIWRTLACSTGPDSDCDPAQRPAPAQRCYLRPCSTWKLEEWSKCSRNCGSGLKSREVQCFDLRDRRPLRPFHCRAVSSRPQTQMGCNVRPCLEWYASSWGQCSEVCGGGEQQRLVTCPEEGQCDVDLQPSTIQSCSSQPCAQWLTGSWGQCSASCGGGVRRRLIKCVNTKAEKDEDLDRDQCDREPQPEGAEKCNLHECNSAPSGAACLRDRLTVRFCQSLRWLGRCQLANVRAQCCRTCGPVARRAAPGRR
ncbi:LOW QUALITY PROTEIN: A disintegrin and metalloproteinase with thrombospondin motifs 7 [Pungitius pungitius]|uniref:LOW QUALITY PROTEIN: A disintegrin and metalloproteinase with thrombospondin motifs 7 n=1 Tax=Pungitius pungitius TaxID=134920 RepID=UPI002E11458D